MSSLINRLLIVSILLISSFAYADIKSDLQSGKDIKTTVANASAEGIAPDLIVKGLIANKVEPAVATTAVIEAFPSYIHVTSITRAAISAAPFSSAPAIVSAAVKAASEFEDDITNVAIGSAPAQKAAIKAEANKATPPFVTLAKISEQAKKEPEKTERQIQENASVGLAGVVLATKGKVIAMSPNGEMRVLIRRSKFFAKDVIKTGPEASAQLRFEDNAIMGLRENSELKIQDYRYGGKKDEENKVVMQLVSGGFRTISGTIGSANRAAYSLSTPAATIGIRGTDYDIVISLDGKIIAAVWGGGITIKNDLGSLDIGAGSPYIFAAFGKGEKPAGSSTMPKGFIGPNGSATALSNEQKQQLKDFLASEEVDAEIEAFLEDLAEEEEEVEQILDIKEEILEIETEIIPEVESPQ